MSGRTTLRTERLELRPVQEEDVDRILAYRNDPEVVRWLLRTEVDPDAFRDAWRAGRVVDAKTAIAVMHWLGAGR